MWNSTPKGAHVWVAAPEATPLHAGEADLQREGRFLQTDHGHFVLVNVYAPNAGVRPARARLGFKLRWLRALQERLDSLAAAGRHVVLTGDLNVARSRRDAHPSIDWQNVYLPEVRCTRRIVAVSPCALAMAPWARSCTCVNALAVRTRMHPA